MHITNLPVGVLFIEDCHLDDRSPSSRVDDYQETTLEKLQCGIDIANERNLLAFLGGDVFNRPHIDSDYVKARAMSVFQQARHPVLGIPGNHDMSGGILGPSDSLWLLGLSRSIRLITQTGPHGVFDMQRDGERIRVGLGGTPYGQEVPMSANWNEAVDFGIWATHDNFKFQTHYEDKKSYDFKPIHGVDIVVNGHLHHASMPVDCCDADNHRTTWYNPGSVTRTKSNEKDRVPSVFIVYANGMTETVPIHLDGDRSVFSSSSGRTSKTRSDIGSKNEEDGRNRFTDMLSSNVLDEFSVGELLDQAVEENKIDQTMRKWLEDIALAADVRK